MSNQHLQNLNIDKKVVKSQKDYITLSIKNEDVTEIIESNDAENPQITFTLIKAILFSCMGVFLFGYHLSVINGPLDAIAIDIGFANDSNIKGFVVSSLLAGATFGSLIAGSLADYLGRCKALLYDVIILSLGPFLCATANSIVMMVAGRMVTGIAIGIASAVVPVYLSEISPVSIRGTIGSINQLFIVIGVLVALIINIIVPASNWRFNFFVALIPAVLLFFGILTSPESPKWLETHAKVEEMKKSMMKLWKNININLNDKKNISEDKRSESVFSRKYYKIVFIAIAIFLIQQFSGINAIIYFSSTVFKDAGISQEALASAGVGLVNLIGTILSMWFLERAGRKTLLMGSYTGMAISMLIMALFFSFVPQFKAIVSVVGTITYMLSFGLGVGPIPALYVPEISADKIRGQAMSLALTSHWICNFAVGQCFLKAGEVFGISAVYYFFSIFCIIGIIFSWKCLVETKGETFDKIQKSMIYNN